MPRGAACVVSDALTGLNVHPVVLRYSGDTVLVVGDTSTFTLTAQVGDALVDHPRFRYTIDDSTIVGRTAGGAFPGAPAPRRPAPTPLPGRPLDAVPPALGGRDAGPRGRLRHRRAP